MSAWAAQADRFPADVAVGRWVQANDVPGRDLGRFLRDVGSTPASLATAALVVVALLALRRPRAALLSAVILPAFVLQTLLKVAVDRPRTSPDFLDLHASFTSTSFPSGHVMSSTLAGVMLLYLCWRIPGPLWLRLPVATWGLGVFVLQPWAAVSLGVHWPSDVLGGWVWAALVLIPVLYTIERLAIPGDAQDTC